MELGKLGILGLFDGCTGTESGRLAQEIERRGYAQDGRTVEFTRSLYRGDSYDYVAEFGTGAACCFLYIFHYLANLIQSNLQGTSSNIYQYLLSTAYFIVVQ